MILAAIETSTPSQSVAVARGGAVVSSASLPAVSTHGRELSLAVGEVCERAGIALGEVTHFVVGAGPGSFTGLRVGLAFARGCAAASGATVGLASSLRSMAYAEQEDGGLVAIALDARRGEVWSAVYRRGPTPLEVLAPGARKPLELVETLRSLARGELPLRVAGNGLAAHADAQSALNGLGWKQDPQAVPDAAALGRIAWPGLIAGAGPAGAGLAYLREADAALPALAQTRRVP